MNYIDIILGGLLVIGLVRGIIKGLFVELASLVAIIAGVYGAIRFSFYVGDFLKDKINIEPNYVNFIAFVITFIVIILGVTLLGRLLTKVAKFAALGLLNRVLGGAFGMLKFAFILSAVIMFISPLNKGLGIVKEEVLESAILYQPIQAIAPAVYPTIIEKYKAHKEKKIPPFGEKEGINKSA